MNALQIRIENTIVGHSVDNAGQRKHGSEEGGAERENRTDRHDPFEFDPTDLFEDMRKWGLGVLLENSVWIIVIGQELYND